VNAACITLNKARALLSNSSFYRRRSDEMYVQLFTLCFQPLSCHFWPSVRRSVCPSHQL